MKRVFDFALSLVGLFLTWPFLAAIALWIRIDSPGPALFRQQRVGRRGRLFLIHKFRTMRVDASSLGPQITVGADSRITGAGRFLRKYKLDELPQLWDVLRGEMSLVGPRPEVPQYVDQYPPQIRDTVLSVRPGITDPASLEFFDEAALLGAQADPEAYYRQKILPRKLEIYSAYARQNDRTKDLQIVLHTIIRLLRA